MEKKHNLLLIVIGVLVLVGVTISVTYAFMSVSDKQEVANTLNTNGCLNVAIENEGNAISLSSVSPITDLEGLETTGYTFTIKNTCSTKTNYQINLESLNESANSLKADYIRVALSSDTMDNLVSILSSNTKITPIINNAYEAYNLYSGELEGNTSKTFRLREWMDYDTTVEQGASKTYTSKINVIANPDIEVVKIPEIKTTINNFKLTGEITGSATNINYCISSNSVCETNTNTTITNNKIELTLNRDNKQIVCTKIGNNKTTCTDVIGIFKGITVDNIIAANNPKTTTPDFSQVATTDEGVYSASDGMYGGTSYYWRGASTTNHVIFADKCWRIIRINGDGSIRLIYNGAVSSGTCTGNGSNAGSIAVTNQAYNPSHDRSEYVGWTYSTGNQRTTGGTASNIKSQTETWYNNNIGNNDTYKEKVVDGKFCNDRNTGSGYTWSSQPSSTFYYAARGRLESAKTPTLSCPEGDVYTLKVGIITADEVVYVGGVYGITNSSYYLYNGKYYWTMSPYCWWYSNSITRFADVFIVRDDGQLTDYNVYDTYVGVRPIINLKTDILFATGGEGTQSNPYVVL